MPRLWGTDAAAAVKWIGEFISNVERGTIDFSPTTDEDAGLAWAPVLWLEADVPSAFLPADGTMVFITSAPDLYARIGSRFNTGGEPAGMFRLPNLAAPITNSQWIIRK